MIEIRLKPGTRNLLIVMLLIVTAMIASAYIYYRAINQLEDPRLITARKNFARYDRLMRENQFSQALALLDVIEADYRDTPGYADSYELGVIANNRASVYLVKAESERLSQAQPQEALIAGYLKHARRHTTTALHLYRTWLSSHETLTRPQVIQKTRKHFKKEDPAFAHLNLEKIVAKRADDIMMAIQETRRRLSVTHTNMGVIARYQGQPADAKNHYELALSLWDKNHVARNNLNTLQGIPLEKPSVLQTLFPPDRHDL